MGLTRSSSPLHSLFTYDLTQQELMDGQEEEMLPSSKESQAEMKVLQEEMQLVLKKEREAQVPVPPQSLATETILFFHFFTLTLHFFVLCRRSSPLCVHLWLTSRPQEWILRIFLIIK